MDWNWLDIAVGGLIGLGGAYISVRGTLAATKLQAQQAEVQRHRQKLEQLYANTGALFHSWQIEIDAGKTGAKLDGRALAQIERLSQLSSQVRLLGNQSVRTSCSEAMRLIVKLEHDSDPSQLHEKVLAAISTAQQAMCAHLENLDS